MVSVLGAGARVAQAKMTAHLDNVFARWEKSMEIP